MKDWVVPVKDWVVTSIVDRGPGHYYRYQVTGINMNHPEGHSDRAFSWSVPSIDDDRYDLWALTTEVTL